MYNWYSNHHNFCNRCIRASSIDNDDYVTCFVIAAVDYPLGGIPEFFVTGLVGGLGVNRDLIIPPTKEFLAAHSYEHWKDLVIDPMGALDSIRTHLPAKRDSYWFAVGVKFTTYQVLETKGVLFIQDFRWFYHRYSRLIIDVIAEQTI